MCAILVVLLIIVYDSNAFQAADCSNATALENLDLKSLEGTWYELSSSGTPVSHRLERCFATTITAGSDGKSFVMANDRVVRLINTHIKTNWTVEGKGDKLTGDLTLKFKLPLIGTVAVPFKILGTDDYKNYIILHACYSVAYIFKSNLGFIFTRKRNYQAKELESLYSSIDKTLKTNGLRRSQFTLSNQSNCEDKSTSPSNTDSSTSTEEMSANESQTESSASTNGAVEEGKTFETPVVSADEATSPNNKIDTDSEKTVGSGTQETAATKTEVAAASKTE